MALYVIRVPDPPVGLDFAYTVPGQYLEDIVSVTATLTTQPAGAATAHDSSGNGFDGTYHGGDNTGWFFPGIVSGDLAFLTGSFPTVNHGWLSAPYAAMQWAAGWTFALWVEIGIHSPSQDNDLVIAPVSGTSPGIQIVMLHPLDGSLTVRGDNGTWQTAAGAIPIDGTACFIAVTWDGATMTPYIDGAAVAWAVIPAVPITTPTLLAPFFFSLDAINARATLLADELAVWAGAITAGDVAAIFAARSVSFAAYSAAVLATAPAIYYHLDDGALGESRVPTCEITDGTYVTGRFPSGFPAAGNSGAYQYTWSARQAANSQTANGLTTSISLPKLVLPAGYTIGTFTPGLGGLDQWSNINIWWDSSLMDSINGPGVYEYPPGAHLYFKDEPDVAPTP